jgi:two-component system, chemotaxis family, sensor kinase CheA
LATASSIEQFKQSFREEAREILVELEATLLGLHDNPTDQELVGKAFRGLHTIKGSGAMFGFDDLAAFTHKLENAFDAVRNGELIISAPLVDLTLAALDQIRWMVDEGLGSDHSDPDRCAKILAEVATLVGAGNEAEQSGSLAKSAIHLSTAASDARLEESMLRTWNIRFAPGPELLRDGTNPLLLLNELRQLGTLEIKAGLTALPPLAELDPERCYVSWEMTLRTTAGAEAIRDVFIFVEDSCELSIEAEEELRTKTPDPYTMEKAFEEQRTGPPGRRPYDKPDSASSIRVPATKLDQFVDLVGELVTVQARLGEIAMRRNDPDVVAVAEEIERLTSALRENSMNIRMLPIRSTFERFRRLVHDLARDLHKDVELTIEGADTELDKTVIDQLSDPLMHLIRNSMDHGIERSAVRVEKGKRPTARIHLSARHSGANVLIGVSDDGGGIHTEAVRARGIERGLIAADAQLSDNEIFSLIFEPGFSTAKQITDVSGRGVGMDVVRQRVDALRGSIDVTSRQGVGTCVTLRLPLTLAIIDGLLVSVDDAYFVLPLAHTLECIELSREDIERANGKHVANVRGEIIPYIRLRQHFHIQSERPEREQIMVVETEEGRYGFVVDRVLGDYQTVIKNLGRLYRHVQIVSGATILGNGTVALILDPHRLVQDALRMESQGIRGRASPANAKARDAASTHIASLSPPSTMHGIP